MKQEKLLSTNRCDVNALEITKDCKFLISEMMMARLESGISQMYCRVRASFRVLL
jgi:hypothetical protein